MAVVKQLLILMLSVVVSLTTGLVYIGFLRIGKEVIPDPAGPLVGLLGLAVIVGGGLLICGLIMSRGSWPLIAIASLLNPLVSYYGFQVLTDKYIPRLSVLGWAGLVIAGAVITIGIAAAARLLWRSGEESSCE